MPYHRILIPGLLILAMTAATTVRADQVTMANGDRLSGTVVRKSDDVLIMRSIYAGELRLPWAQVAAVTTDEPVVLLLDDGPPTRMRLASPAPELARIRYINPTPAEAGTGYHRRGRINLALSQTRGNSADDLYRGDGELVLRAKTHRITITGEANYARDGGVLSSSNWRADTRYDYFFKAKEFVYTKGALEKDRFKDIRLRSILGGGYGYQIIANDTTDLSLRGGLDYVRVDHDDADDKSYAALGWGVEFRHRLEALPAELFHVQDGTYGLGASPNTVLHTRTGLRLPLSEQLNTTAQINVDWESRPAPGRKQTDTTLLFGFGYTFH